jgi:hypothetical protein
MVDMEENKYLESFADLQSRITDLMSEIQKGNNESIQSSYLSFLDNFLVLIDQIINSFHEGKIENEQLAFEMTAKQNMIMSTLSTIISYQKDGNWGIVASIIEENLEKEIKNWKETVITFFAK